MFIKWSWSLHLLCVYILHTCKQTCTCRDAAQDVSVQLKAMQTLCTQVTCTAPSHDGTYMLLGTASGHVSSLTVTAGGTDNAGDACTKDLPSQADAAAPEAVGSKANTVSDSASLLSSSVEISVQKLPAQHPSAITALAVSSTGRFLASLSQSDGLMLIWAAAPDAQQGFSLQHKTEFAAAACLVWAPDLPQSGSARLLVGTTTGQLVVRSRFTTWLLTSNSQ